MKFKKSKQIINGKPRYGLYQHYCLNCNTKISIPALRCRSCGRKYGKQVKWSEEQKEKRKGEGNPNWKGNKVKYGALHDWVKRYKPKPKFCEICKKNKSFDLANISGKYKRDINDFEWLCRKCHMKDDGRLKKLVEIKKR